MGFLENAAVEPPYSDVILASVTESSTISTMPSRGPVGMTEYSFMHRFMF